MIQNSNLISLLSSNVTIKLEISKKKSYLGLCNLIDAVKHFTGIASFKDSYMLYILCTGKHEVNLTI